MQFEWAQNPLETKIIITDHEKEILWHKVRWNDVQWNAVGCHLAIEKLKKMVESEPFDIPAIRLQANEISKALEYDSFYTSKGNDSDSTEKSGYDAEADHQLKYLIQALDEPHVGDCTCVPCSCTKCQVEDLLGIDTLSIDGEYPGKHVLHYVSFAFKTPNEYNKGTIIPNCQTIDEAIEWLDDYDPSAGSDKENLKEWFPKWKKDADSAAAYMRKYKIKHFSM